MFGKKGCAECATKGNFLVTGVKSIFFAFSLKDFSSLHSTYRIVSASLL